MGKSYVKKTYGEMVRRWRGFFRGDLHLEDAEADWQDAPEAFDAQVDEISRAVIAGEPLARLLKNRDDLAVLAGLDRGLADVSGISIQGGSPIRIKVEKEEFLVNPVRRPRPPFVRQAGHLQTWLTSHRILPMRINRFSLKVITPREALDQDLNKKKLRFYLAPFDDKAQLERMGPPPRGLRFKGLKKETDRLTSVINHLKQARKAKADVAIFPELTITRRIRDWVSDWLEEEEHPFLMVLAGSFHDRRRDPEPCAGNKGWPVNRTVLFDRDGEEIMNHVKLKPYGPLGEAESIDPGRCLTLLKTSVGYWATPICRDFSEAGHPYPALWETAAPDWALVPMMTTLSGVSAALKRSKELALSSGTRTLAPTQPMEGRQEKPGADLTCIHGFVRCDADDENVEPVPEKGGLFKLWTFPGGKE